jgi:hypothetical protein
VLRPMAMSSTAPLWAPTVGSIRNNVRDYRIVSNAA